MATVKFWLCRSYLLCGFCLLLGLVITAGEWTRGRPRDHAGGDTLVLATTREPTTLHPVLGSSGMANVEVMGAIFEPLTVYDDRHRLVPCLATEVPTLANGGLRLFPHRTDYKMQSIWHLRPDACWSDGEPVTADDFKFTWQLILDPRVPAVSREMEERIRDMESRDGGRTLVVYWKEPYAFAQEGHRHLVVPRHVEEPRLRAAALDNTRYEYTPFNHEPVGNGPYRVVAWPPGRSLVLEPQPFWHGPTPHLKRIEYRFIPEGETILANLDTGRVGAVSPVALDYDLAVEYDQRARARGEDTYVMHYLPGLYWDHIDFNTENPLTADKRVRQALMWGLDREAICRSIFGGRVSVTDTWLPPLHPAAPPPGLLPHYGHDPRRAAALLDAAGWKRRADGRRFKDGRPLRLTLSYQADEPISDRIAQMVREDWQPLGVELNLRPLDAKQFDDATSGVSYQGLSLYYWVMDPSADGITFWTTANIPTGEKSAGQNACRWRNPRSDELLERATRVLDPKERRRLLWEEQGIWADELPDIPLWFREEISISHRRLRGWRPTGSETPITWNCQEWRWEDAP